MKRATGKGITERQLEELANFRYVLRNFLHFSEQAASRVGLPWQQHQLLLQVAGAAKDTVTTPAYLAERLAIRHHSVLELSQRCEDSGLLMRGSHPIDRRLVVLKLTALGTRVLQELSEDHVRELQELGPRLIEALQSLTPVKKVKS